METKIPFYNIVNMLLTGFVFIGCCVIVYNDIFMSASYTFYKLDFCPEIIITTIAFAVIYEVGFIINRVGSIIIEPILIKRRAIPFDHNYKGFNDCKNQYPILEILSREYAFSRTSLALFLITTGLGAHQKQWNLALIFFVIAILFYLSCRKHAKRIVCLMDKSDLERASR